MTTEWKDYDPTWKDYDPTWLVEAARDEYRRSATAGPWLFEAISTGCTRYRDGGPAYHYFVDRSEMKHENFLWTLQIETSIHGRLNLDILKPLEGTAKLRVGGVEFLDRLHLLTH